ncbi:MAG TPA: hypothetical protein VK614_01155 [Allosphingosinicella sp.]|nr:hypothetical protein [Allosphingosinicella sp.]
MTEDERIAALFASPPRGPDEAFVARVARAVQAEQRFAASRRRAWRRFAVECAASAAIVTAFDLVWRLGPAELPLAQLPVAPAAAAAILVLALWFAVELRPSATGR